MHTPTDAEMAYAKKIIDKVGEPTVKKIVESINEALKAKGLMVGAEVQWFIDGVNDAPPKENKQG